MHVGSSSEPPELPEGLSLDAKHFILACLKRNPSDRPNVRKLLQHPFISGIQGSLPRQAEDTLLPFFTSTTSELSFNSLRAHNQVENYSLASGRSVVPVESSAPPSQPVQVTDSPTETEEAKDLASANPNHNVSSPFGNILPASVCRQQAAEEPKQEEEVVVLRRDPNETCKSHSDSYASGSNSSSSGGGNGSLSYGSILISQSSLELKGGKKQEKGSEAGRTHQSREQTQQFRVVCVA